MEQDTQVREALNRPLPASASGLELYHEAGIDRSWWLRFEATDDDAAALLFALGAGPITDPYTPFPPRAGLPSWWKHDAAEGSVGAEWAPGDHRRAWKVRLDPEGEGRVLVFLHTFEV